MTPDFACSPSNVSGWGGQQARSGRISRDEEGMMIEGVCAYCGVRRAVNRDHVIPQSIAKKFRHRPGACPCSLHEQHIPAEWLGTVPSCLECNVRKGNRRLVPESWESRLPDLNEFFGGTPWRVWRGDTSEPAYAEAWR